MADLSLEWKDDVVLSPSGDLVLVNGSDMTRQRIERRLFTAVNGYVWHSEYGAGLPQRIGRVARSREIQALVRANIALESSVAQLPVPQVTVDDHTEAGLYAISINYSDAVTGAAIAIQFEVPGRV